jgi:xanthine dehydrogenase molybdenum-binding subunit
MVSVWGLVALALFTPASGILRPELFSWSKGFDNMTVADEFKIIGTAPIRPDGVDKVTGRANYAADVFLPRMLYGRLKRAPYAHAIIKKIDASKALALPGVEAVVTSADFDTTDEIAGSGFGAQNRQYLVGNFLAFEKVLFYGHPVAAVAATSPHIAEDALDLIEVEYEVLPPVMSAQRALEPDAPILHPRLRTAEPVGAAPAPDAQTNVASHLQMVLGDIDAGFASADIVLEDEFHTGTVHQGYLEPHSATVQWNPDGSLVVYSSSQGVFGVVRDTLATILKMPTSMVRAVPMEIGGGFGGKLRVYCEPIAAMLAKKAGKPVKVSMTREEVIQASGPASGTHIRAKIGAMNDGRIVAAQLHMLFEAGAFPGSPVGGGMNVSFAPYDIPNVKMDGYDIVVNRPRNAAYRAPGAPAPTYAIESLMDELARRLDMDPLDVRIKNAAKEGTRRPNGSVVGVTGNVDVMEQMKATQHYRSELTGKNRGRGVAVGFWGAASGAHSMNATVNNDGTVALNCSAVDVGGLRAAEAEVMAEMLGIPYEDVKPRYVDTSSIGWTGNTGGSGTASGTSASAYHTALQIRDRMIERAAKIWECDKSLVTYGSDATLIGPSNEEGATRKLTFKQIAAQQAGTGGYISGHVDLGGATGAATYGGHIVDVEVDTDTGKVTVLRYTVVQDVGRVLHKAYAEGQMQGGAVQGIGMALTEEYYYDNDGVLRNASLLDYRIPTALDAPMIETVLVEVPHPGHPLGVRGVGECNIVPPLGAIANAVRDAVGLRLHSLPATPRVLLEELMEAGLTEGAQ